MNRVFIVGLMVAIATSCLALGVSPAMADDVTARPPGPSDDITKGYQIGDDWCLGVAPHRSCFRNLANTAGAAAWTPFPASPLFLDLDTAVPPPTALWSTHRAISGYTGNSLGITRTVGGGTYFGWSAANANLIDWPSADAFCAGFICQIYDVFDQSGNGYVLQAVGSPLTPASLTYHYLNVAGERYLMWDGTARMTHPPLPPLPTLEPPVMGNAALPYDTRSYSIAWVGRQLYGGHQLLHAFGTVDASNDITAWWDNHLVSGLSGNYAQLASPIVPPGEWVVNVLTSDGAEVCLSLNERRYCSTGPAPSMSGQGILFGWTTNVDANDLTVQQSNFDGPLVAYWNVPLSPAQIDAFRSWSLANFNGLFPQKRNALIVIGDSGIEAVGAGFNRGWAQQLNDMLTPPRRFINAGLFGAQSVDLESMFYPPDSGVPDTGGHIFIIEIGSNDLAHFVPALGDCGLPLQPLQCRAESFMRTLRAYYPNDAVIWVPVIDRGAVPGTGDFPAGMQYDGPSGFRAQADQWNGWLAANCAALLAGPGACVSATDDAIQNLLLYAPGASANRQYFNADGVHPTGPVSGHEGDNSGGHAIWAHGIYNVVLPFQ